MSDHHKSESIHHALDLLLVDLHRKSRGLRHSADALGVVWRNAVGEFLARNARPLSLAGGRLRVGVSSPSLLSEMEGMEADLLERLNHTGQMQVSRIALEIVPSFDRGQPTRGVEPFPATVPPEPIPADELPVIRPELQAILHRLLAHHRQRRSQSTRKS